MSASSLKKPARRTIGQAFADYEDALRLIAGTSCWNYTSGPGACIKNRGRKKNAKYGAERWCDACIAYDALQKAKAL